MRNARLHAFLCRGALAVALSTTFGLGSAAAEAPSAPSAMTTVLKLKSADGATESLRFDGALAIGESRGYETDAGTPVLVTRTAEGLSVELPSHTVQLALPAHGPDDADVNVERRVRVNADGARETRVVVLRGEAGVAEAEHIDQLLEGDPEALETLSQSEGSGEREIVIVRKQHREDASEE